MSGRSVPQHTHADGMVCEAGPDGFRVVARPRGLHSDEPASMFMACPGFPDPPLDDAVTTG